MGGNRRQDQSQKKPVDGDVAAPGGKAIAEVDHPAGGHGHERRRPPGQAVGDVGTDQDQDGDDASESRGIDDVSPLASEPPDTGGIRATSSEGPTGSEIEACSPFLHTAADPRPAWNPGPKRAEAASMTSPTVVPSTSTFETPASSRRLANRRRVATQRSVTR